MRKVASRKRSRTARVYAHTRERARAHAYLTHAHTYVCTYMWPRATHTRARTRAHLHAAEKRVECGAPLAADRASDPRGNNYRDLCYLQMWSRDLIN